jgi:hypothetical protein
MAISRRLASFAVTGLPQPGRLLALVATLCQDSADRKPIGDVIGDLRDRWQCADALEAPANDSQIERCDRQTRDGGPADGRSPREDGSQNQGPTE